MTSTVIDPRVTMGQIPQGAFVVVVSYARIPCTTDPAFEIFINDRDKALIRPQDIPMGVTVYLGEIAMPGQSYTEITFEPVVWRQGVMETALRASRARARTEPVVAWVSPLRGHRPVYAPLGPDSLPSDAIVVVGRRARWAQEEATFEVIRRHVVDGVQCNTPASPGSIRSGQHVWLATRYLAHDEHSDLHGWTFMEVAMTPQVRDDLIFDMWAFTEPRTGGSYFDRDRFPRYVPLWQVVATAVFIAFCGMVSMTDSVLRGFAIGGIFFGVIYLAAWLLQGSPDPYVRRENVDGWHFVLSAVNALLSTARTADSSNEHRLVSAGMTGFWAALAYEDHQIRERHRNERKSRVR